MRYLATVVVGAFFFFVPSVQSKPNSNPPSVIPGPTKCEQANCKRRRVWKKRFRHLTPLDKGWLKNTRECEWKPPYFWKTNTGNGYFGAYQFSASTAWKAGFTMLPHRTWRFEQDVRALRWRNIAGAGQWPICGH